MHEAKWMTKRWALLERLRGLSLSVMLNTPCVQLTVSDITDTEFESFVPPTSGQKNLAAPSWKGAASAQPHSLERLPSFRDERALSLQECFLMRQIVFGSRDKLGAFPNPSWTNQGFDFVDADKDRSPNLNWGLYQHEVLLFRLQFCM